MICRLKTDCGPNNGIYVFEFVENFVGKGEYTNEMEEINGDLSICPFEMLSCHSSIGMVTGLENWKSLF